MRVDLKELNEINIDQNEILIESTGYLSTIAENTENNKLIPAIVSELQDLNSNIKNSVV